MKVLTIRLDRLGDVLLSLPALDYVKRNLPDADHAFAVRSAVAPAIRPFLRERGIREVTAENSLKNYLNVERPDAVLLLHAPSRVYRELFWARVPLRFGMYSTPSSFLFLNGGVRQRRSRADRSEGVFNGELAEALVLKMAGKGREGFAQDFSALVIPEESADRAEAQRILATLDINGRFLVVHPGMGGSALNLSAAKYHEVLEALAIRYPYPVLISKGPAPLDQTLVEQLLPQCPGAKVIPSVSLGVLREIFRQAHLVIGPSTGPLHLAHYVGTATLGLFSPVRSQRPLRWRPWGGEGKSLVLTPEVTCPAAQNCLGQACPAYNCMEKAHWNLLLENAGDFI